MGKHVVLIGCNYKAADGSDVRHEPGAIVEDIPEQNAAALLEMGAIEPADVTEPTTDAAQDKPTRKRAAKEKE
jgi:hypothetical protein